ncbi:MAG: FHA domain-containing protein [Dehalococcoidia bacterium]
MKFGSLQVRTPDGVAHDFPIDLPSLVIGRADGNGIVIDDLSISRRHARIIIESGRLMIEDLGSAAGTFVGGHRIDPGTSNLVELDQDIRFGDVAAQFVPPPPATASEADAGMNALADGTFEPVEEAPSRAISVTVTSPPTPVEPGGAVFATAVIQNRGRVVDLVTLGVTGIPTAWVNFSQPTLALVPGSRETVTLVIQPPLASESLAGEYDFGVVVTSGEHEREGVAFGKLTVTAFAAMQLSLSPVRSKRNFMVLAKNNGNALATYALSGVDDEGQYLFEFATPSVELQPGEERRIPLKVRRRRRQFFGQTTYAQMRVIATPTAEDGRVVETLGQILVKPALEPWKTPVLLALLIGLLALAFWLSWIYRDQIPTWIPWSTKGETEQAANNAEAAYAGVHMCDKTQEERDAALAKVTPPAAGTTGSPLFAQNNPTWAKVEYAKAGDPEFGPDWCGTTIEQCGCAMTSVATIMAIFNIVTMPDGSELTPQTVNAWFNNEARKTPRGWVSDGYVYGDVIWTAANELSGQIAKEHPGSPTVRFAGFGTGSEEEILAELKANRPVILEVPGHYIAAIGVNSAGKILINDPYYADRLTLDAYKGKVLSSVKFEPSNDLSGVVITVPKDLRVRVLDKNNNEHVVGSLTADEGGTPVPSGIEGAYLSSRDAWRDPTCVESPPPAGAGTTSIFLPGKAADYRVEVLNPGSGGTSVAIHSYDQDGNSALTTQDSTGAMVLALSADPTRADVGVEVVQGTAPGSETPTPGGTPTLPSGGNTGGGGDITPDTPTPAPTAVPTATKTPAPTPTPVPPSAVTVKCDIAYTPSPQMAGVTCTGAVTGTYTTTRWTINDLPAPVPPGSTAFSTSFTKDTTATVEMTACNITNCVSGSAPVVVKFTTPTPSPSATPLPGTPTPSPTVPAVGPPPVVTVNCDYQDIGSQAQIDCETSFVEAYNTIAWTTTGGALPASASGGAKHFTTYAPLSANITVQATVCYNAVCTSSNVAYVLTSPAQESSQVTTALNGSLCGSSVPPGMAQFVVYVLGGSSSDPPPTGSVSLSVNGMSQGIATVNSGQAVFMADLIDVSTWNFLMQYSGDSTWTSAAYQCVATNGNP